MGTSGLCRQRRSSLQREGLSSGPRQPQARGGRAAVRTHTWKGFCPSPEPDGPLTPIGLRWATPKAPKPTGCLCPPPKAFPRCAPLCTTHPTGTPRAPPTADGTPQRSENPPGPNPAAEEPLPTAGHESLMGTGSGGGETPGVIKAVLEGRKDEPAATGQGRPGQPWLPPTHGREGLDAVWSLATRPPAVPERCDGQTAGQGTDGQCRAPRGSPPGRADVVTEQRCHHHSDTSPDFAPWVSAATLRASPPRPACRGQSNARPARRRRCARAPPTSWAARPITAGGVIGAERDGRQLQPIIARVLRGPSRGGV